MIKWIFYLVVTITSFSYSQDNKNLEGIKHTINSVYFRGEREITVYLPLKYDIDSLKNYVVAYVFDGQFQPYVNIVKSAVDLYSENKMAIPMIIVGIKSKNRSKEFTPKWNNEKTYKNWGGNVGNSDTLALFLKEEVFPLVDSNYRTQKYKLGIGHSLGGTFLLNEMFNVNSIFQGIIAVSPNLVYDDEQIIIKGANFIKSNPTVDRFIYATAGDVGDMENKFANYLRKMDSIVKSNKKNHEFWNVDFLKGKSHMSNFIPSLDNGLLLFSEKWIISDDKLNEFIADSNITIYKSVENFYSTLSIMIGDKVNINENEILEISRKIFKSGKKELGLKFISEAIQKNPKFPLLINQKGIMNEMMKDVKSAKKEYEKAMDVLVTNKSNFSSSDFSKFEKEIKTNLDRCNDDYVNFYENLIKATKACEEGDSKKASKFYTEAFKIEVIRGTHLDRLNAVKVFAKEGEIEQAFHQLYLLANTFIWNNSETFLNDSAFDQLKTDSRWLEIMKIIEENNKALK